MEEETLASMRASHRRAMAIVEAGLADGSLTHDVCIAGSAETGYRLVSVAIVPNEYVQQRLPIAMRPLPPLRSKYERG